MLLEIVLAVVIGVIAGIFTGLFPGIHINLVAAGLLALISEGYFSSLEIVLAVFVVAMAVAHTFIDFIPSVYLGAPEEDSFLAVLPGHQMLREGRGHEAVVMTLLGGLAALPLIFFFTLVFVNFLPLVFEYVQALIPLILIFASLYLVFREEEFVISLIVFLMAGFLGLFVFNLPVKEPLLPLLTGLFGISGLVVSLRSNISIPKQEIIKLREIKWNRKRILKSTFAAAIAAPLSSFLPGMGAGHAAVMGSELMGDANDKRSFLFLVGAIGTIVMALSFVSVYAIDKARTGAAVAVDKILGGISPGDLILLMAVVLVSGILAFVAGVNLSKVFSKFVGKVDYRKLSFFILILLIVVNFVLTNFLGMIVLITGSALGVFCVMSGARRINLMGVLMIPTIVFYLFG